VFHDQSFAELRWGPVRNRGINIWILNTSKNSKYLSKCRENFYAPFVNTGCQLPLVFWPLNVFIDRGFSGYENFFFRGSSMDESLGNTLLGTLGYLLVSSAWSTLHLQECRLSYQHGYLYMVLLSWKPHQKTFGTKEFVK